MKTKLVYVLVSTDNDLYWEQALLSVFSARYYNPTVEIILVTDDKTNATLQGKRAKILDYITTIKVIEINAEYTNQQRSRILKTTLRQRIAGDYLFIDCDTIITTSLSEADTFLFDIAAVQDAHISLQKSPVFRNYLHKIDKKTGWNISQELLHFNSGVLYVKDNACAKKFYADWHNYWLESMQKGYSIDQPALAMANNVNNHIVCELPGEWNCQLRYGLRYFPSCKIIHFCATDTPSLAEQPLFELMSRNTYRAIKQSGEIDETMAEMLKHPKDFVAGQTDILANNDVLIWNAETGLFIRRVYYNFPRIFKCFNFVSKCLLYFDKHIFKLLKK